MAEESEMRKHVEKPAIIIPEELCMNISSKTGSHRSASSTPSSPVGLRKAAILRNNCLCSPTTHAGSFRCRYHRNSLGLTRNSMSVGSKLSDLVTDKSCGNLHKRIIAGHHQGS